MTFIDEPPPRRPVRGFARWILSLSTSSGTSTTRRLRSSDSGEAIDRASGRQHRTRGADHPAGQVDSGCRDGSTRPAPCSTSSHCAAAADRGRRYPAALERGRLLNSAGSPAAAAEHFVDALGAARSRRRGVPRGRRRAHAGDRRPRPRRRVDRAGAAAGRRRRRIHAPSAGRVRCTTTPAGRGTTPATTPAALAEFEAALAAYSVHGTDEQVRVARWALARALRSLARFDEALAIQLRLAAQGPADGYVEEELAELLLATGDRARPPNTPPRPCGCSARTAGSPSTSPAGWTGCGSSPRTADRVAGSTTSPCVWPRSAA